MDAIELVREQDGLRKAVLIDVWSNGRTYAARVAYQAWPANEVHLEEPRTDEATAERDALAAIERLRGEGWKDELSTEEQARVDRRIRQRAEAEKATARSHQELLDRFPASEVDRRLADAIAHPDGVVRLDLRGTEGNRISVLPPAIKKLKELEILLLEGNGLTTLPQEIEALKKLRVLRLARNRLTDSRPACYLKNLVLLDLHDNHLTASYAGAHQKGLEVQLGGNPIGKDGKIGWLSKTRALGVDTETLFPIGDRAEGGSSALEVLQLYGRAPTDEERAEAKKNFPNARVLHHASTADGPHIAFPFEDTPPSESGKKRARRTPHADQAAHEKALVRAGKKSGVPAKRIKAVGRPCVELYSRPANKPDLAPGGTRIGGVPDLPRETKWPSGNHGPMVFLAQMNLADLAPFDPAELLPKRGLLLFFAGGFDEGAVLCFEDAKSLAPAEAPTRPTFAGQAEPPYAPCGVRLVPAISLPRRVEGDIEGWFDLWESHRERDGQPVEHRLLGHSFGDTEGIDDDEIVLLALGSDDRAKMNWGDAGTLYFCFDRDDLLNRRWDKVRVLSSD